MRSKKFNLFPVLFTLIIQGFVFSYFQNNLQWGDQEQYFFSGSWIFFFTLGIYLAQKETSFKKNIFWLAIILVITFGGLYLEINNAFYLLGQKVDVIIAAKSTRFPRFNLFNRVYFLSYFVGKLSRKIAPGCRKVPSFCRQKILFNLSLSYLNLASLFRTSIQSFLGSEKDGSSFGAYRSGNFTFRVLVDPQKISSPGVARVKKTAVLPDQHIFSDQV